MYYWMSWSVSVLCREMTMYRGCCSRYRTHYSPRPVVPASHQVKTTALTQLRTLRMWLVTVTLAARRRQRAVQQRHHRQALVQLTPNSP